jgi:hypothetical protein
MRQRRGPQNATVTFFMSQRGVFFAAKTTCAETLKSLSLIFVAQCLYSGFLSLPFSFRCEI